MKLMMQPGSALLVLAVVAYFARFVAGSVPLIGGLLSFILLFAVVFGVIGGIYLLFIGRRQAA
jgi:succinate dehydrogenase/fumarate reductase cytochrome b subunit